MNEFSNGFLLVLEGIEGCGKTTLATALTDRFQALGRSVLLTRESGGTQTGQKIRQILHVREEPLDPKAEFLLLAADRAQHVAACVRPALEKGMVVISDRMADSSLAHQGYGRGLDRSMIATINEWALDGIRPDLTIYLRLDPEVSAARLAGRGGALDAFEQESREFFARVVAGYDAMYAGRADVLTYDATMPPEVLAGKVFSDVVSHL